MPRINTYSDNASIENDDKVLTYDTQAAATKITAFSTIWNWIVSKLHALSSSSAALTPSTDRVLMDKNGAMTRVEPAAVAKYGIETYNGSTIAGSAQTVKAALDALNSKINGTEVASGTDLNTLVPTNSPNGYYTGESISSMTHIPSECSSSAYPFALYSTKMWTYTKQVLCVYTSDGAPLTYERQTYYSSGNQVWGDWVKEPERDEIDTLNSNLTTVYADISSSVSNPQGDEQSCCKYGNVVTVTVGATNFHGPGVVAVIPVNCRPSVTRYVRCAGMVDQEGVWTPTAARVTTDGNIVALTPMSTTYTAIRLSFTYII